MNLIQAQLDMTAPSVDTALTGGISGPQHEGWPCRRRQATALLRDADTALGAAGRPGFRGPMWIYPPAMAGEGWQVAENKRDWPTRYDAVSVDPDTGAITDRVNFADWPFLAKLTDWAIGAHMGILFGVANQIVLALIAIGLITIVVRGYRMWWQRRPTRGSAWAVGRPPIRGAIRQSTPSARCLVAAAVGIGWFLPLFGMSLLAFLVVDAAIWAVKR